MFNPLYPFTQEVLAATVKRGGLWFVRNTLENVGTKPDTSFLMTHYNDRAKAETHYNIINQDPHRFLYHWNEESDAARLKIASSQPEGYKIYSAYFYPDYKKKISKVVKEKINQYMYTHTNWKPAGSDTVQVDLYLQFGIMYLHLKHEGEEIKFKFADIQRMK